MENSRQIYVACLASYNAGRLHGKWVDLSHGPDAEDVFAEIKSMLDASPEPGAEEFAIHDSQNLYDFCEYESIAGLSERAVFMSEIEDQTGDSDLGSELLSEFCGNLDDARKTFAEYHGCYESKEDYAHEVLDQSEVPDWLSGYVDVTKFARDLFFNYRAVETGLGRVHVFDNI